MSHGSDDLFGGLVPHEWLPNETLFSLCSRHHRLSANHRASSTCQALFGHPSQGSAHDFPSRLGEFERLTGARLGTADEIIRLRTVLPYYLPFASSEVASAAIAAMAGPSIGGVRIIGVQPDPPPPPLPPDAPVAPAPPVLVGDQPPPPPPAPGPCRRRSAPCAPPWTDPWAPPGSSPWRW